MKKRFFLILIAIVIGSVYAIYTTQNNAAKTKLNPQSPPQPTVQSSSANAKITDTEKVIEMEAGAFYFKPNEIVVNKGDKVKIIMKSVDFMHDFNIDKLGVNMPIVKKGDTGTVEFTAEKTGTFEYYCSVGQHRQRGQVGKLVVQ